VHLFRPHRPPVIRKPFSTGCLDVVFSLADVKKVATLARLELLRSLATCKCRWPINSTKLGYVEMTNPNEVDTEGL
jgi:hypothetical protein